MMLVPASTRGIRRGYDCSSLIKYVYFREVLTELPVLKAMDTTFSACQWYTGSAVCAIILDDKYDPDL